MPFLFFRNHRYNIDTYIMTEEEQRPIKISDYYSYKNHQKIKKQKGETALEILQPILLSEPPISSQLIFECIDIFIKISKRRKYLYETGSDDKKIRDQMVSIDMTLLSFYEHRFNFGQNMTGTFADIASCVFPLPPSSSYYDHALELARPVMNGFILNLMLQLSNSSNCFFSIDDSKQFSNISLKRINHLVYHIYPVISEYKNSTNTDYIPEKILYNDFEGKIDPKQKDSDDSDEYEPSKKTKIIVNELSTKKIKEKVRRRKSENPEKQKNDIKSNQFNLVFLSSEIIGNLEIIKKVGSGASSTV